MDRLPAASFPPASSPLTDAPPLLLWEHLPQPNRQRLLWVLTGLVRRQLDGEKPKAEVAHDDD